MARLDAIDKDFDLILNEALGEKAQTAILREFAEKALSDAQATNRAALGYVPEHTLTYDGGRRANLDGIKPNSVISFEFQLLTDIIEWIDEQLILHSPVRSERYARSHVWFADNVEMDPRKPPPADGYVVLNAQPYARKIERGLSPQAPDGVYEGVAALAKARFGNFVYVGFSYRSFPSGAIGDWARTESAAQLARDIRGGSAAGHEEWLTRQPAIFVDPGR